MAGCMGSSVAPQTRVNFRRVVHNFFTFCAARGYAPNNPVTQSFQAQGAAKDDWDSHGPARRKRCSPHVPAAILPAVAIGMFAGLRTSEIMRLDWSSIDLDRRLHRGCRRKEPRLPSAGW